MRFTLPLVRLNLLLHVSYSWTILLLSSTMSTPCVRELEVSSNLKESRWHGA